MKQMSGAIFMTFPWPRLGAALLAGALLAPSLANAQGDERRAFLTRDGHVQVVLKPRLETYRSSLRESSSTTFGADAGMGPIEKAMVFIDAVEGELPHARWLYRFGQTTTQSSTGRPQTDYFVDVSRFNLGPVLHEELQESLGPENVASLEEFGVGPSLSWRFVMTPLMGVAAEPLDASRRELTGEEARQARCFGQPCLSSQDLIETLLPEGTETGWTQIDPPAASGTVVHDSTAGRLIHLSERLHGFAGEGREGGWREPEKPESLRDAPAPFIGGLVETGLGQDDAGEAVMIYADANDDQIRDIWYRVADVAGSLSAFRHTVPWPR